MGQILQSERLFLNSYTLDDRDWFLSLVQDSEVMRFVGGPKESEVADKLFARFVGNLSKTRDRIWAIRLKKDCKYIGHAALFQSDVCRSEEEREILFYLKKPFWKSGFGSEAGRLVLQYAFARESLKCVWATVDLEHGASLAVCERIGMTKDPIGKDEEGEFLILKCISNRRLENV